MTFHVLGIIIPTDELIFFRGIGQPPPSIHPAHTQKTPKGLQVMTKIYCSYQQIKKAQLVPELGTMPGACLNVCQDLVKGFASVGIEILSQ